MDGLMIKENGMIKNKRDVLINVNNVIKGIIWMININVKNYLKIVMKLIKNMTVKNVKKVIILIKIKNVNLFLSIVMKQIQREHALNVLRDIT